MSGVRAGADDAGSAAGSDPAADPAPSAVRATHAAIEAVWRLESARLIAGLARITRDVETAEELAGDALVAALEQWPRDGIPANPGAWLMTAGRNRAVDTIRRRETLARKTQLLGQEALVERGVAVAAASAAVGSAGDGADTDDVGDDLLRLMLVASHPVLSVDARVALTLRLLGGLTTEEIARAFLVPEPTIAQRIVRAKRTLTAARVPFDVPGPAELPERLGSVLEVLYLVFNEGYTATDGADWMRPGLCEQALRLGRILAELTPDEPEVHGLVALMEIQASRLRARVDLRGRPVRLLEQDRARWDRLLIRRGLAALGRAEGLGGARGPYTLQAAIAACHARALRPGDTDWARIAALYDALSAVAGSPVVELNRAVAVAMAYGPEAGLEVADPLLDAPALRDYHLLPAVRGDLLLRAGRRAEAAAELRRAAGMTRNEREQALLMERAAGVERGD